MTWTRPQYGRAEVNRAGRFLVAGIPTIFSDTPTDESSPVNPADFDHAVDVIDNFRAAHAFPLNTLQHNLRVHSNMVDKDSIIAQRLKRFSSILVKLFRFPTMDLWDMQDIGGCRSILHNLSSVQQLVNIYKSPSRTRHKLIHEDDYVQHPRDSGYRSYHLVYRYVSDRNDIYNGLKIEVQIRTSMQHAWATAVETVDAFTQQALKASRGRREWERFFQLMGTEMAFREGTPPVPGTPTERAELLRELGSCSAELRIRRTLSAFATALRVTEPQRESKYFLLSLDPSAEHLDVEGYQASELDKASQKYADIERRIRESRGGDAVLVSVGSIRYLRRAYPNYYADTGTFLDILGDSLRQASSAQGRLPGF